MFKSLWNFIKFVKDAWKLISPETRKKIKYSLKFLLSLIPFVVIIFVPMWIESGKKAHLFKSGCKMTKEISIKVIEKCEIEADDFNSFENNLFNKVSLMEFAVAENILNNISYFKIKINNLKDKYSKKIKIY